MYGLRVRVVASLVFLSLLIISWRQQQMPPPETPSLKAAVRRCASGAVLDLDCAAFPNTDVQAQPTWDYFAWNTFIAANWPAIDPAANNEQRGIPDLGKRFVDAGSDELLTWETYKEKREVFYPPPSTQSPGVWNQAPRYGPSGKTAGNETIPMCSNAAGSSSQPRRIFLQGGKIPETFASLDETAEVPSQALETEAELCAGVQNPQCNGTNPAPCCRVKNMPVMPRVWKGRPEELQPVIYEVKVNYDFFQYVTKNQFYLDQTAANAAAAGNIALPYRTSASSSPTQQKEPPSVYDYRAPDAMESYRPVSATSNLTPYPSGAIHLKAAWILLKDEDKSKYHTTEAAYFTKNPKKGGEPCMATGTFGLVGLHIIQRIHRSREKQAFTQGGTFVFATFEHVDNADGGFTYSNAYHRPPKASSSTPPTGFYPSGDATLPVRRLFPILSGTQDVNRKVHQAIRAANPKSVWLNYELIGVQFQPVHVPVPGQLTANLNDPTNIGQPLFLANSVIETNFGLQYFQGLPPGEVPIEKFAQNGIGPNPNKKAFDRTLENVSYNGTGFNMGGCMGCHGVAQLRGYSFSFVLFLGQRGASVETPAVPIPPAQPPSPQTSR